MKKNFRNHLFSYIKKKIDEKKTGVFLSFASFFYRKLIFLRNLFYEKKIFAQKKASCPVISIGNITCGGTGKTPVTLLLSEILIGNGIKTAIASRGYRSKSESKTVIGAQGKGPLFPPEIIGDEPYLLAKRCPKILLGVGKNRFKSCVKLLSEGAQIILLDDGMQHRKLYRDLEIVVLHGNRLDLKKEHYLPKGFLRDEPKRLKEADLILVNHTNKNDFTRILDSIRVYSNAPVCVIEAIKEGIYSLDNSQKYSIENTLVGVFCAVAEPEPFFKQIEEKKAKIVNRLVLPDHEGILDKDLQKFAKSCKRAGAKLLVCTEKDAVKIKTCDLCLPVAYERISINISHGKENWEKLIDKALNLISE